MDKHTPQQLIVEIIRLQRRVHDLEDEVSLLRAQNDYLQEAVMTATDPNMRERDTIPVGPTPSSDRPTNPSSPNAIRLEDLHAALEASESTRSERGREEPKWELCPICQRADEHEHDVDLGPEPEDDDLN